MEKKSWEVAIADKNFLKVLPLPTAVQKDSYFYGKDRGKCFYEAIRVKRNSKYFKKTFSL